MGRILLSTVEKSFIHYFPSIGWIFDDFSVTFNLTKTEKFKLPSFSGKIDSKADQFRLSPSTPTTKPSIKQVKLKNRQFPIPIKV